MTSVPDETLTGELPDLVARGGLELLLDDRLAGDANEHVVRTRFDIDELAGLVLRAVDDERRTAWKIREHEASTRSLDGLDANRLAVDLGRCALRRRDARIARARGDERDTAADGDEHHDAE